jgi:pilus assembly protein CpaE
MIQIHPEFLASVQDAETYEAAVACAKGQGWPGTTVVNADITEVTQSISRVRAPGIILIDLDNLADPLGALGQLISICGGRSKIVVVGSSNDVSFYRSVVHAGATDYLVKPVNSIALRDSILPLLSSKDTAKGDGKSRKGLLYAVIGARGGVGATTIAVNASWLIAHELNHKVALIDMDLQFGNCDLALDLVPPRGLRELLSNPSRMDSLLISSSMAKEGDNLSVFCCEESIEEIVEFDSAGPAELIDKLRKDYDAIIIDMPRLMLPRHRRILTQADHIILVTDLTLSGLRDVPRIISSIENLGSAAPISLVASRIGDGAPQLQRATFERSIKTRVLELVPHDVTTANLSATKGKAMPEVAPDSAVVDAMRRIVKLMTGEEVGGPAKSKGFMAKLLGKRG